MTPITLISLAVALLLGLHLCGLLSPRRSKLPLPPGPSLLTGPMPVKDIARTFQIWSRKFGPVVHFKLGGQNFIVLGTRRAAQDLLEKRASIYSSRPPSKFLDNYLHKGLASAFMPYGPQWRLHRRLSSNLLSAKASTAYQHLQDIKSKQLLHGFLSSHDFSEAFLRYTSDVMFTLVYGKGRGSDDDDHKRLHQINEMAVFVLQKASYGMLLLDLFPYLDWLPKCLLTWREKASELHEKTKDVYTECSNLALRGDTWNWSHEALQRSEAKELPWDVMCYSLGELYVAGIHTTKMVLEIMVMVCILQPIVMKKAQEELDSVVGPEKIPSFGDIDNLPYIRALVSELLRWRPISPIGVPHAVIQEDEYMGYAIPAGSTVIANQLGMNEDETVFDKPQNFNPDRYLENPDLPVSAFGFGRRLCPGHHLARNSLHLVTARLLWAYDISAGDGNLGDPVNPASFKADFHLRNLEKKQLIESESAVADQDEKAIMEKIRDKFRGVFS